jgi:SRSO17 transposase
MDDYRQYFNVARRNVSDKARCYLAGLVTKAPRKNMERMEEYVEEYDYQAQQQFLSDSPWSHEELDRRIGRELNELIGGDDSTLVIDESGFAKKGVKSAGVARQWNGRVGKVDNCQVGVFAALSNGQHVGLVSKRLYLPKEWTRDRKRCEGAKIPGTQRRYRSKTQLAWEMIQEGVADGLHFGWIALDALYGSCHWLLLQIDDIGKRFVADVRGNQHVYAEDPEPYLPRRKEAVGRKFTRRRARTKSVRVDTLFDSLPHQCWSKVEVREGTRGTLTVWAARQRVWLWDGKEPEARCWWAVCTIDCESGDRKWFLSNAAGSVTLTAMVRKHADRYWIERAFQDAKTSLGMADYQARGWVAWQHHMSMVMLAMLFMIRERMLHLRDIELLSFPDLVELLTVYLPRADVDPEAVRRNIERRHRKRQASIESARRRQKQRPHGSRMEVTK